MRVRPRLALIGLAICGLAACSGDSSTHGFVLPDTGVDATDSAQDISGDGVGDTSRPPDGAPLTCVDVDVDGIADSLERNASASVTGDADDDDGDGFSNLIEGNRAYPIYSTNPAPLACRTPDDCDSDGIYDFQDTDSDNDGLSDAEERAAHTNPCAADTDGDGVDDLTEVAAGSSPTDPTSVPPMTSLYVTLPYHAPGATAGHVHQEFPFMTRIQQADVFILVDNSASMQPIITTLRQNLSVIVDGVHAAIPDARIGIGSFDSVPDRIDGDPGTPGDYTLWIRHPLTSVAADPSAAQTALNAMQTIDADTNSNCNFSQDFCGGDYAEDQVEALFELIDGGGMFSHLADAAARRSVHNGLDPTGDGFVPTMDPALDCNATATSPPTFGWGCFQQGRLPIIVLCSDAAWYNGYARSADQSDVMPTDPNMHTAAALTAAMNAHGAFYVGIDVGQNSSFGPATEDTLANSRVLATATHSVDGSGAPLVFSANGNIAGAVMNIVSAVGTIAGSTRQNITTAVQADSTEARLIAPHTTADFITAVTPVSGAPPAPTGFDSMDATTFYNVAPTTTVTFGVDFYNDFQPQGPTSQLFTATIQVLGRSGSVVDRRDVYIIVPAAGM